MKKGQGRNIHICTYTIYIYIYHEFSQVKCIKTLNWFMLKLILKT